LLIFFIAAVALLCVSGWLIASRLRAARPTVSSSTGNFSKANVSLIIPARNEEHNLPKLLASLGKQQTRLHELIVIDDGSSDRTAEIARSHGARVITSAPLPEGWRGENGPRLRNAVCANLENFGIKLDPDKNAACRATEADISTDDSPAKIFVIPANEELVLAREVYRQISNQP